MLPSLRISSCPNRFDICSMHPTPCGQWSPPANSQRSSPGNHQGPPTRIPSWIPQGIPPGRFPPGTPLGSPPGTPQRVHPGISPRKPSGIPPEIPLKDPRGIPQGFPPQGYPQGSLQVPQGSFPVIFPREPPRDPPSPAHRYPQWGTDASALMCNLICFLVPVQPYGAPHSTAPRTAPNEQRCPALPARCGDAEPTSRLTSSPISHAAEESGHHLWRPGPPTNPPNHPSTHPSTHQSVDPPTPHRRN